MKLFQYSILLFFFIFVLGCKSESQQIETQQSWQLQGLAVIGHFADPEIVSLDDGTFRLYYSIEPEVAGNKLELYSARSSDGIHWEQEEGTRKEFATFPGIIRLPNGQFRLYFQNSGVIKSALSSDGLLWTEEEGVRIDIEEEEFKLENVGASTTVQLSDGTYIMVYRGVIEERYSSTVPNDITSLFFFATSLDGLHFEKKGIAVDSRNDVFEGWLDGAEFVQWDEELRLYFWSYSGIYHTSFNDGLFSSDYVLDISPSSSGQQYPGTPPADPTLVEIDGTWFLYYGQHQNGIYYATYGGE